MLLVEVFEQRSVGRRLAGKFTTNNHHHLKLDKFEEKDHASGASYSETIAYMVGRERGEATLAEEPSKCQSMDRTATGHTPLYADLC